MCHTPAVRRTGNWWQRNWDTLLLWALVIALAIALGNLTGAIDDTVRMIRSGY